MIEKEIFEQMFAILQNIGILATNWCKGAVKRALVTAGFEIEKLPDPPGKKETVRPAKLKGKY